MHASALHCWIPALGLAVFACSPADKDEPGRSSAMTEDGQFIEQPGNPSGTTDNGDSFINGEDQQPGGSGLDGMGVPKNIGTEEKCDGIDENNNGIIDDVDAGNDGLCDCLNIAFLGELKSDAGDATGAFEDWLEARSTVPVTHISSTATLTAETFASLQVVIVGNMTSRVGTDYSAAELAVLESFLKERGGGIMSLGGYTANESHMAPTAQLMGVAGLGYDYQGQGPGILGEGAPPVKITGLIAPEHPILEGVEAVGVYYGYPVTGDGEALIKQGHFVLAQAKQVENGRAFAFADEWITQDKLWVGAPQPQPLTQCQQRCAQCEMECTRCDTQCTECTAQPCQGGADQDPATCPRGCDGGCQSCSDQCTRCEAECTQCQAQETAEPELDMARFWLNSLSWLTPSNECKVKIPPNVRAK